MAGITSYGAYVPYYRLSRKEIARAWDGYPGDGYRSVANWDEDTITMAVEAVIDSLRGFRRNTVDGLIFATTSHPFWEKSGSALIAAATDLKQDLFTIDCGASLRAGTSAMKLALDAVNAGTQKNVVVAAADCRLAPPNSGAEGDFGDGAAAFMFGTRNVAVEVDGVYSYTEEFTDRWRRAGDEFVKSWEERFVNTQGYNRLLTETVSNALKAFKLKAGDVSKLVFPAHAQVSHNRCQMVKSCGFTTAQVQDPMFDVNGNTGCAFPLQMLVAALEEAQPGDRILLVSYSDGGDVFNLRVTEHIEKIKKNRRGMKKHLATTNELANYGRYLLFRGLVSREYEAPGPVPYASLPREWRERTSIISLHGSKCRQCGEVQFPVERVCPKCLAKDDYDEVSLAETPAQLYTYNLDYATATSDPPNSMIQVDFKGGGRIQCIMADRDPNELEIGMPVEMTFRRFHEEKDIIHYYWKARPPREPKK
ncbi:MAG: zinc ribbon domain-containing protein [Dehalococcoidia bacterium]